MSKARQICFDRILPQQLRQPRRVMTVGRRVRAISPKNKQWINGSTITIRFLEGTTANRDMVREIAALWTQHANLEFAFTDDPRAQIRVSFDENDGAWSYVGTDNLSIPLHAATLNLGWVDEGVILHEFGHMIGLAHEHSSPRGGIQWDEEVVIRELSGPPNYWDEETIRHNVFRKYGVDQIHGTEFDHESIMLYAFPAEWTLDGQGTHANEKLSDLDKQFVASAEMYPRAEPIDTRAVELDVAASVQAEIATGGEEDLYKFKVEEPGVHTIETLGATDVVLALFGPDSETAFLAEDDDGGIGRNARITANLQPGTYFAAVRHYSDTATGSYRVLVHK